MDVTVPEPRSRHRFLELSREILVPVALPDNYVFSLHHKFKLPIRISPRREKAADLNQQLQPRDSPLQQSHVKGRKSC